MIPQTPTLSIPFDVNAARDLRRQATLILDILRTGSRTKRHGSYEWYTGDTLSLWRDSYTSALAVTLPGGGADGEDVTVFSVDSHGTVTTHRPGDWTDTLATLAHAAGLIKHERQAARHAAVIAYNRLRWAPVADARRIVR